MPSMIGLIMLMGIATKNSILLVDYVIMRAARPRHDRWEAMLDACHKRARPIVMTTIAMGAGMMPIALGLGVDPSFRAPMAIVVIGGLITSTFLSLLVIPVLFTYVDDVVQTLGACCTAQAPRPADAGRGAGLNAEPRGLNRRCRGAALLHGAAARRWPWLRWPGAARRGAGRRRAPSADAAPDPAFAASTWTGSTPRAPRRCRCGCTCPTPPARTQPVPLVVFSHGIGGSRRGYSYLGPPLGEPAAWPACTCSTWAATAACGSATPSRLVGRLQDAAQDAEAIARVRDLRFALDRAAGRRAGAAHRPARIVAAGHCYGANTTLLAAGARVRAQRPATRPARRARARRDRASRRRRSTASGTRSASWRRSTVPSLHVTATDDVIRIPGYYSGAEDRLRGVRRHRRPAQVAGGLRRRLAQHVHRPPGGRRCAAALNAAASKDGHAAPALAAWPRCSAGCSSGDGAALRRLAARARRYRGRSAGRRSAATARRRPSRWPVGPPPSPQRAALTTA